MTQNTYSGVWVSDRPLDLNEGACGDTLLRITLAIDDDALSEFEWVEEDKGYREWLVPASLLNAHGLVSIEPDD